MIFLGSHLRHGHALALSLRGAQAYLRRRTNLALDPFGITADQYVLLSVLAEQVEATQQELVRACFSDTAIGFLQTVNIGPSPDFRWVELRH